MTLPKDELERFRRRFLTKVGQAVRRRARKFLRRHGGSRTIDQSLQVVVDRNRLGFVQTPYYWGVFVHDGRGPISLPAGRFLIWFADQRDDPRLAPTGRNYPKQPHRARHLTSEQFFHYLEQNRIAKREGRGPVMIFRPSVGPVRPIPFFDNDRAMKDLDTEVDKIAERELLRFLQKALPRDESSTAKARL